MRVNRAASFFVFIVVACTLGSPVLAASSVSVKVTSLGKNQFHLWVEADTKAPPERVWNVLTDYNHHAQFMPYIVKSQVVKEFSDSRVVEQEGRIRVLLKSYTIRVRQRVWEAPKIRVHFQAVDGDFHKLEGTWVLSPLANGPTKIRCGFIMEPRRWVPAWAVRFVARVYLTRMVSNLLDKIERGQAR